MFYKFTVLKINKDEDSEASEGLEETLLLNSAHIISIKPIRMIIKGALYGGHWVRLSNGKKYRAIEIPKELKAMIEQEGTLGARDVTILAEEEQLPVTH